MNIKNVLFLSSLCIQVYALSDIAQDYIELAKSAEKKGNIAKAETYFLRAQQTDANDFELQYLVANFYANQCNYEKALEFYRMLDSKRSDVPEIHYNIGFCNKMLGAFGAAKKHYEKSLALDPKNSMARQGLSHALLGLGEYEKAWPHFEYRWGTPRADSQNFIEYYQSHKDLHGKKILLRCEYGMGDTLQFIRYAQLLKEQGAYIIAEVQTPLASLLVLCPYLDRVIPADSPLPEHDFACTLMSLPYAFKTTLNTIPQRIPYLYADASLKKEWQKKIAQDTNFKVGVCWNGNVYDAKILQQIVQEKSVPLVLFEKLATIPHVSFYSLQKTSGVDQLKSLSSTLKIITYDNFDEDHGRFMDTAALIESLDLIITIDTSIAHLAGGLGKKTWVLLPHSADWRWMENRSDSPWYSSMKLFRQKKIKDWHSLLEEVKNELEKEILNKQQKPSTPSKAASTTNKDPNDLFQQAIGYFNKENFSQALELFYSLDAQLPNHPFIHYYIGKSLQETQHYEKAIEYFKKTIAEKPDFLPSYSSVGTCYLTLSEMETAWKYWKQWFSLRDKKDAHAKPLWQGEDLHGKRILIEDEGGFGDIFQWVRFTHLLKEKGAYVILETKECLIPLLSSCKAIDEFVATGNKRPQHDVRVPFERIHCQMNMALKTISSKVPYLYADQNLIDHWQKKLSHDQKFKVGVCWNAQQFFNADTGKPFFNPRSIPLSLLAKIACPEITLYSLQQKTGVEQLKTISSQVNITHFSDDFDESHGRFMDTAALIMNMDLVITVDTSIAHLAGALGKKVWVLVPQSCDWRWFLKRTDSPWYPTMRLFRQTQKNNWDSVIDSLIDELEFEYTNKKNISQKNNNEPGKLFYEKGISEYNAGNLEGALFYFKNAKKCMPLDLNLDYNLALTYRRTNQLSKAIDLYNTVLLLSPSNPNATFGLAQSYLAAGNIEQGWQLFNAYRHDEIKKCPTEQQLKGKTIIIKAEWGLGDFIHYIRYAKLLRQAGVKKIIAQTPTPLVRLMKTCSYIDQIIPYGQTLPAADYEIPLLYLPTLFKTNSENLPQEIPYMHADNKLYEQWNTTLKKDTQFKIGICWDIGHHDTNFIGWQRSAPLEFWKPFEDIKGIKLYSLQKNGYSDIIENLKLNIHDFGENFDTLHGSFMDSAAVIKNMDLIITVDTAIAHLAGALGAPVWLLLPYSPDYRWTIEGSSTPWYPTMQIFRQEKPGQWGSVMKKVCDSLKIVLGQSILFTSPQSEADFKPINSKNIIEKMYQKYGKQS